MNVYGEIKNLDMNFSERKDQCIEYHQALALLYICFCHAFALLLNLISQASTLRYE